MIPEMNKRASPFIRKLRVEVHKFQKLYLLVLPQVKHYGIDYEPAKFIEDRNALLQEMFPTCDLMPGVLRFLIHLKLHGVPMAVATSSHKRHFDLKTAKHKRLFDEMFNHVVTGDDVEKSKPEPEIFLLAAEKFGGTIGKSNFQYKVSPLDGNLK